MPRLNWGEPDPETGLSPRETRLVHEMSIGYSQPQICRSLSLSEPSVRIRTNAIMERLGLSDRFALALHYVDAILAPEYREIWVARAEAYRTAMVEAGAVTDLAKRVANHLNAPGCHADGDEVVAKALGVSGSEVTDTLIQLWQGIDAGTRFMANSRLKLVVVLHLAPLSDV